MRALVVLPTYNERDNVLAVARDLLDRDPDWRVCVVDDSSPDGTAAEVSGAREASAAFAQRVHLIVRGTKDGRGGAVREGFRWGTTSGGELEAYVEMDCDFSHEPQAVAEGLALLARGHDVVIGARYPDGTISGWPLRRRVFSFLANQLARTLIDRSVSDYTNGFRFYSPRAARLLVDQPQRHKGYIYLSESLSYLLRAGLSVASFPIRFRNRERGVSNTDLREIRSALFGIFEIAAAHRRPR
jgi:dolichol-phosphate mannosyltransferase